MSSIILLFITHTTRVLSRISEAMRQQQAEWFTNRSGHSSFRAEVVQSERGVPERTVRSVVTGNCGATEDRPDVAGKLPTVTVSL
ncbi:TPA: hypothetical protein O4G90_000891 [Citrobacter amalonaticus]|nr:hypothetical protein [Citrobacter amalonaticus]